jgi:hypothetical protein
LLAADFDHSYYYITFSTIFTTIYREQGAVLLAADFDNNCVRRIFLHEGAGEHVSCWAGRCQCLCCCTSVSICTCVLAQKKKVRILTPHPGERVFRVGLGGAQFTCFAGKKVQLLTLCACACSNVGTAGLKDGKVKEALFNHPGGLASSSSSGPQFTCFTSTNAQIK